MVIGILKEQNFNRVSLAPSASKKLAGMGLEAVIESGAGEKSGFGDHLYTDNSFTILTRIEVLSKSDIVLSIAPISDDELSKMKNGAIYISMFAPYQNAEIISHLSKFPLNVISMDMIPRTTLAQSMDILSSMASLSGYKAVLKAADHYNNMFPMMMTAAGTIPPTKVMILGAGVAGLQAIATAKRLGAVVEAFDTRAAAKEEVMSLGANFVEVDGAADDKGAGGYAIQQSDEYLAKQRALVQERALKSNIIIATAQVRGRKAPLLVTEDTIDNMKPGSVIVDLAASTGGNCAYTENNRTVIKNGVIIIGNSDLSDELNGVASTLYSNNVINFLQIVVKDGKASLNEENEIIKSALISKVN
ncbi:MAG: NAD(P) transhydrogenase subunit alpha [Saprospiraceae bacterium]|jgi:NAD(P) transhydrogenase subunit alpha|nr:NAD(P) transhydrogenase subunit alpha [Saprospiraceae bacterium]